ncbi:M13 family metallopeptidase [Arthrobacter antibioticus]|uniref:M13 family metallopeptidase n=1 Tax=Arthrobacter sp. H35-MC1 TaxID=3046203 RepID=UPI0024B8E6A9|nr:M13-type metalloendopeptidase [Arthrobacter sp. H35-MC1]MDJ0315873.1 M13-type metalloendopeptidase [Arthrobacter sp. H35-MC1]
MTHSGINLLNIDHSTRPQDDLFEHVNGLWLASEVIPDDRALTGSFITLRDESEAAVKAIIEHAGTEATNPDAGNPILSAKIGALYSDFMDEAAIERAGASPLTEKLEAIHSAASITEIVRLMGELDRTGGSTLFGAYVNNDAGNPERALLHLFQAGLGLPDESYYREEKFEPIRSAYISHVQAMLELAGVKDAAGKAPRIMALETEIAATHLDKVSLRDPQKTYNLKSFAETLELLPALETWLEALGVTPEQSAELVVATPGFFTGQNALLVEERRADWQAWLAMRTISSMAGYLSKDFVDTNFAFYGTTLSGTPAIRDRWKRGVALVEGVLGEAVGQLYVAQHFPESHKAHMEKLVANLIEAYRTSIVELRWMSEETKDRALEKLAAFTPKIGYPAKWRDYSKLEIVAGELLANVERSNAFELARQLAKIGAPIDREEWLMSPQTVNAYYNPTMNEVVFPAAILQPPFYDAEADDAANYGGIGAVIGHEIGHGFDDQGSQFDGTGALRNWWTDEDRAAFEKLTARLVQQYNKLSPTAAPNEFVNGELTLGENIGDLGGLAIGFKAYQLSLNGTASPVVDGLTGAQRFFFSWAECWRTKIRTEEAIRRLTIDPHSPGELRCNAVASNLDAFHEAFGTTATDAMWLEPAQRVSIW